MGEKDVRNELECLGKVVKIVEKEEGVLKDGKMCFEEWEILEFLLEMQSWSVKIKVLVLHFADLAKKYGKFTVRSLRFVIDFLLAMEKDWFSCWVMVESIRNYVVEYLEMLLITKEISFAYLVSVLQLVYQGNSLFFDKTTTDLLILEAFVSTLGEFKGNNYEDCVKTIWEREIDLVSPIHIVKGLILEPSNLIPQGFYLAIHYSDSNFTSRHSKFP